MKSISFNMIYYFDIVHLVFCKVGLNISFNSGFTHTLCRGVGCPLHFCIVTLCEQGYQVHRVLARADKTKGLSQMCSPHRVASQQGQIYQKC